MTVQGILLADVTTASMPLPPETGFLSMLLAKHLLGSPLPHHGWRAQHWWWSCLWVPGENIWRAFSCGDPLCLGNRLEHTVTRVW